MSIVRFITHPDVRIEPDVPVPDWSLSERGRERMERALALPWMAELRLVWSSQERKAVEGAEILSRGLGIPHHTMAELGENDRSATGFLPKAEFEATADAFFARPEESVRGWERAVDAQTRIVQAMTRILTPRPAGDIAIVAHGAVGALLLCYLKRCPISRDEDQPPGNGGNYFSFDVDAGRLLHGWQPIDG
ncbi:histidine phosphatase family protein [Geminicoccus harenae]|uniref:histidine phosphatase family protein n=1 Tax=Geminicoccus harenae TaxID=2498453 RepID=UPI00168B6C58|nr:histidine phosphatase family protein [Geminicoccus harenae]